MAVSFASSSIRRCGALLPLLVVLCASAAEHNDLRPEFREFLHGPTSYLLTKNEKSTFSALRSDEDRSKFIEKFWEVRNPKPGTGSNEFKEEFYRRLAFVNTYYGKDAGS